MISVFCDSLTVKARCQFKTIPGVTHITLTHTFGRDSVTFGTMKLYGGIGGNELHLDEETIICCLCDKAEGNLALFKEETVKEISEAVKQCHAKLANLVKASK
ncbi:hypothetical protein MYO4S_00216 [Serratia phage 4S]|nr:hypothetical protein MYO4S_00216 [Serratia phage 4S]